MSRLIQLKSNVTALPLPDVQKPQVEKSDLFAMFQSPSKTSLLHFSGNGCVCLTNWSGFFHFPNGLLPPPTSFWPCPLCSLSFRPILRRTWIWLVDQVSTSQVRISKWPGLGIELGHIFFPFCFICVCLSALHVLEWAALNLNPGQEKATPLILPYALLILFPCSCLGLLTKIKPCLRGIISYLWHM